MAVVELSSSQKCESNTESHMQALIPDRLLTILILIVITSLFVYRQFRLLYRAELRSTFENWELRFELRKYVANFRTHFATKYVFLWAQSTRVAMKVYRY